MPYSPIGESAELLNLLIPNLGSLDIFLMNNNFAVSFPVPFDFTIAKQKSAPDRIERRDLEKQQVSE